MNLSTQVLHHPEFLKHLGPKALTWLADLFTIMTWEQRIPKIWRQEKIIALTKPGKDPHLAASYRPISLLSICYKQLERANLQRISPRVRNKLKVQNSSTFQGPKLHFSSTKIIDKKPYPRCGHSKFRLQCDTEVYWTVLTNTVMIKAKFQHLQDLNSGLFKDFQVLSSTLSVFKHFQGPSNSSIFKDFSSMLWTLLPNRGRPSQCWSGCNQVTALTTFTEHGFEKTLKTGAVFMDLTAALVQASVVRMKSFCMLGKAKIGLALI